MQIKYLLWGGAQGQGEQKLFKGKKNPVKALLAFPAGRKDLFNLVVFT